MNVSPAAVVDCGGMDIPASRDRPAGQLRGGAFDPQRHTIFLGPGGHPDGMVLAGGSPDTDESAGISIFETVDTLYWANDSVSLPKALSAEQVIAVQLGLATAFSGMSVSNWKESATWPNTKNGERGMAIDLTHASVAELMTELDRIAFVHEPDFCRSRDWRPQSAEGQEVFERLTTVENRPALRRWYGRNTKHPLNANARMLKECLEQLIGERL